MWGERTECPQFNEVKGVALGEGSVYAALLYNSGFANGGLLGIDSDTGEELSRNADERDALAVIVNGDFLYLAEGDSLAAFESGPQDVITLQPGWSFVAIPNAPVDNSVAAVFGVGFRLAGV